MATNRLARLALPATVLVLVAGVAPAGEASADLGEIGLTASLEGDTVSDVRPGVLDANKNGLADAGDHAYYLLKVANDGDYDFSRVTIADPKLTDAGVAYHCSVNGGNAEEGALDDGLRVGGSSRCYSRPAYRITTAEEAAGSLSNTATVRARVAGLPGNVDAVARRSMSVTLDRTLENALTLTDKTTVEDVDGNGTIGEGDEISFRFAVRNVSKRTLTSTRVSADYVGAFTCANRTLAPGQSTTCTARPYAIAWSDVELGGVSIFARGYADAGTAGTAWATGWASAQTG